MNQSVLYILREVKFCPRPPWETFVSGDLHCPESCLTLPPGLFFLAPENSRRLSGRVEDW